MDQIHGDSFPIPTSEECRGLGIYIPPLLTEIEKKFGHDALAEFLRTYGGRRYWVIHDPENCPVGSLEEFLSKKLGGGELRIPFGPVSFNNRRRVAVLRALKAGKTVSRISNETRYSERSIYSIKARFKEMGLLPNIKKPKKGPTT